VRAAGRLSHHARARCAEVTRCDLWGFIAFKALFAGVLATVVTPLVARASLADVASVPVAAAA
jgi:hypothetical protein